MSGDVSERNKQRLRMRAELLSSDLVETEGLDNASLRALVHELKVHQIELELQNDELRRTQLDLERTRDRFAKLFNEAPVGYLTVDRAGIIVQANRTFAHMVATDLGRLPQMVFANFIDARDRELYLARFRSFFRHPENKVIDVRLGNDADTYVRLTGRPGGIDEGVEEPALLLMVTDITDRKRAEQDLTQREEEYRRLSAEFRGLLDAIPDTVTLQDRELRHLWVNRAAAELLANGNVGQVVGRTCYELWGMDEPCGGCPVLAAFEKRRPQMTQRRTNNGRLFAVRTAPVVEDERVRSVIKVGRDMTDFRQLEELAERGRRMDSLGRLAGGIAHGFNNLLTGILGNLSLAQMDLADMTALAETLEDMQTTAERAAQLTQQLLALSSRQVMLLQPVSLNQLIEQVQTEIGPMATGTPQLGLSLSSSDLMVQADAGQLQQVLYDLALCGGQPGERTLLSARAVVHLSTERVDLQRCETFFGHEMGPGQVALITVHHPGLELSHEQREHLFEPFFFTREDTVWGLGLAAAYGIVTQHQGAIGVLAGAGGGTLFRVYLPLTDGPALPVCEERGELAFAQAGERVLLVEDEPLVRDLATKLLERTGYAVFAARDGRDALAALKSEGPFDIMVADVVMPELAGGQLAARAAAIDPAMAILFVSGCSAETVASYGVPVHEATFMSKPYTARGLASKVRQMLDRRRCAH